MAYLFVFAFVVVGAVFVAVVLTLNHMVAPNAPGQLKQTPYECGELTIGTAWVQFNVGYYLFALIFLLFEVETLFVFPWASAYQTFLDMGKGGLAFAEMGIFIAILGFGLLYAWRKGALEWV